MTTQVIVKALKCCAYGEFPDNCELCPLGEAFPKKCCDLRSEAADLIEMLTAELKQAKQERNTWKRRAEAAEYDMLRAITKTASACDICKYSGQEETPCSVCNCVSHWQWRGPYAENGGADDGRCQAD